MILAIVLPQFCYTERGKADCSMVIPWAVKVPFRWNTIDFRPPTSAASELPVASVEKAMVSYDAPMIHCYDSKNTMC